MDALFTVISVLFTTLVIATAVTFGFVLFLWILGVTVLLAVCLVLRQYWRRWRFIRNAEPERNPIIEVEYKDITDHSTH